MAWFIAAFQIIRALKVEEKWYCDEKNRLCLKFSSTIWPLHGKITVAWLFKTVHSWIMNLSFLANNGNEIILRVSGIRWVWEFNKTNCTLCSIYFGSVVFLTTYQINQPKIERKLSQYKHLFQPSLLSGIAIAMLGLVFLGTQFAATVPRLLPNVGVCSVFRAFLNLFVITNLS